MIGVLTDYLLDGAHPTRNPVLLRPVLPGATIWDADVVRIIPPESRKRSALIPTG